MAGHEPPSPAVLGSRLLTPSTPAAPAENANAAAPATLQVGGRGFRHLLEGSPQFRPFHFDGRPVNLHDPAQLKALRGLIAKLSKALRKRPTDAQFKFFADPTSTRDSLNNTKVPSGFTYLLQLVAHDLVQSATSLALVGSEQLAIQNNRTMFLALQTIYGGGPAALPLIYRRASSPAAGDEPQSPAYLRLGSMKDGDQTCPFRDLARINIGPPPPGGLPDVLIADARNDDHAILSQLTTVFHLFHNGIVAALESAAPAGANPDDADPAFGRYATARRVTTLVYRQIVRRELLPLILHPVVWEAYKNADAPLLEAFDGRIPLEFSYGAFRLGHAMLRPKYKFNDSNPLPFSLKEILEQTSERSPGSMPFTFQWAAAWSLFFNIGEVQPNLSRRIQPFYSTLIDRDDFPAFDETGEFGLAYRDMLSAAFAGLWSVPALIERLCDMPHLGAFFQQSWLADQEKREAALRAWLKGEPTGCPEDAEGEVPVQEDMGFEDAEVEVLAREPPLPFFLLFEAWHDSGSCGRHFGPVASVIVAEVIIGALAHESVVAERADLGQLLARLVGGPSPPDVLDSVAAIRTMADMIKVTARMHGLENVTPAFL